ncbi:MAG: helix-turn-helix transcriptional regulator [Streptococcaceae bacterium]|jgi:transcriptional regulator with XRE-family HTH domain|nr:helix-turn-helix transcriptional regulator [Streptococcaceae bacterium]
MAKFSKENMKKYRELKGYSLEQLAKILEIARPTVSRYELGAREPSLEMIEKIANALEISMFELIEEEKGKSMSEKYAITLRKEVLKEFSAGILAKLIKLEMVEGIDDEFHPITILGDNLSDVQNERLLWATDMKELDSIEGYLQGIQIYVEELVESFKKGKVA